MGDIVESHAYNFKKEVGYDLFKQCEEIADRLRIAKPTPPRTGDQMTELTAKYYAEILETHIRVKEEEGVNHPTYLKLLGLKLEKEEREEREREREEREREREKEREAEMKKMLFAKNQLELVEVSNHILRKRESEKEIDVEKEVEKENDGLQYEMVNVEKMKMKVIMGEVSDDSPIEERSIRDLVPDSSRPNRSDHVSPEGLLYDELTGWRETEERKEKEKRREEKENEEDSIKEEISMIDIDTLPAMRSLLEAIEAANKVSCDTYNYVLYYYILTYS